MVGRGLFPFGARPIFRGYVIVSGGCYKARVYHPAHHHFDESKLWPVNGGAMNKIPRYSMGLLHLLTVAIIF